MIEGDSDLALLKTLRAEIEVKKDGVHATNIVGQLTNKCSERNTGGDREGVEDAEEEPQVHRSHLS